VGNAIASILGPARGKGSVLMTYREGPIATAHNDSATKEKGKRHDSGEGTHSPGTKVVLIPSKGKEDGFRGEKKTAKNDPA